MQHSSPSIGAIAGALAKAQVELANPEKSLTGTISAGEDGGERTFRYAPLSSGLDIVRKSLGRHEIATVQTTSIDSEAGLIRLTTVLAHSSGEWISSEFPVCPVAETSTPHRLGAALTYARRFALFALVGIAGEDDADAPDLAAEGQSRSQVRTGSRPPSGNASSDGNAATHTSSRGSRAAKPLLEPHESARERSRLETELAGLSTGEELTAWASRVFAEKNALTREDAAVIEQAFALRMENSQAAGENNSQEEASDRPRTPASPHSGTATPATITPIAKTPRRRDKKHLRFVSRQPCLVCGRAPSDAHHLRFAEPRALGAKVSDEFTVPLCRVHHRALHNCGDERSWWHDLRIDPSPVAAQLWSDTR
jgi:hypothetical protein